MKNSKIKIIGISLLTSILLIPTFITPVDASSNMSPMIQNYENSQINSLTDNDITEIDPYVKVISNKYILQIPDDSNINQSKIRLAQESINASNNFIEERGLVIDKNTKTAVLPSFLRSAGKNDVDIHWNFIRIYIDKGNANLIKNGALGAASFLAGKVPNPYLGGTAVVVSSILAGVTIKNGIWIDYNFLTGKYNNWGWQ